MTGLSLGQSLSTMLRLFIEPVSMEFAAVYKTAADAYNRTPPSERNSGFDLHCDLADVNNKYSTYAALVGGGYTGSVGILNVSPYAKFTPNQNTTTTF